MIYRRKMYKVAPNILDEFNKHFNETLLPSQLKYGARLVGRWMTKENEGAIDIFAIWEYDSYDDYEIIENKVKSDEEHVKRVQKRFQKIGGREKLNEVFFNIDQDFIETTVPIDKTILSQK
ncbi:NIPSNAP family protein [Aquibacillus rhizosphaerae]|uniref:NIPSNAP family protein n=1 Tax=Aquibacillus rhizosphaerae TaxID=3051431 RepID=A0ABT7LCX6_9BACI|nr:NIPSNAP family protein [Aquibacillus sp. LR5S19]MDL4842406.1 NIPSNAP family protein [Aquibacillus sp. LR5S19]